MLQKIQNTVKKAWLPTLVATAVFFITYFFFGMENTMISPIATLSFLRFRSMCNHYECMIKNYIIYIIMACVAFVAMQSLPLCILMNALALFWIAYLLIDEYNPTNYFPAGMALIFFQIAPVETLSGLGVRILALLATFAIVLVAVFLINLFERDSRYPIRRQIAKGFAISSDMIAAWKDGAAQDVLDALHKQLCDTNKGCSSEIYSYNRAGIKAKGKVNWYCQFILVFQVLNYLVAHGDQKDYLSKAEALYHTSYEAFSTTVPGPDYHRLNFRVNKPDIRNFRLRFALRQVLIMTPALAFCRCCDLSNVYWLVISIFFMMIPFSEHTVQRVRQRVLGTIGGIAICMVLFSIFKGFTAHVIIMTIANFFIYGASGYGATVAYITCSALAMQTIDTHVVSVLADRMIYTLIGAGIALIANKCLFPIRMSRQLGYLKELLKGLRDELVEITNKMKPGDPARRKEIDQRIIKSYLLSKQLEYLCSSLPEKEILMQEYRIFEKEHMSFLASYMSSYLIQNRSSDPVK